jgi:hypothetical protein
MTAAKAVRPGKLRFAPTVAVHGTVVKKFHSPQRSAETARAVVRQERQDPAGEERLAISREFASHGDGAESAKWKHGRHIGVEEQTV